MFKSKVKDLKLKNKKLEYEVQTLIEKLEVKSKAICKSHGPIFGGEDSAVNTGCGYAGVGYGSVAMTHYGRVEALGSSCVVMTMEGLAIAKGSSLAMGTSLEIGRNSVGVLIDDRRTIKKVLINAPKDSIEIIYGSTLQGFKKSLEDKIESLEGQIKKLKKK